MDLRELFRSFRRGHGMYVQGPLDYRTAVAFVTGVDCGTEGAALYGFREFLVLRLDDGDNLGWLGLVTLLAPTAPVDGLFDLLDEFLSEVGSPMSGRRQAIFREYQARRMAKPYYLADLDRFGSSPAGELLGLDAVAVELGVDRGTVLDMIYDGTLRAGRIGAALFVRKDSLSRT